jgi:transketolase
VRNAFVAALSALAARDPRIMLVTGDLGFGVLDGFARDFPAQFLNAGVAEQNMTAVATGMALDGRVVFTYSIANFPTLRCLEHIRNDACYHGADVKVVAVGGGFSYGPLGISHHATEDLAIMRSLPEMTVVAPGDDWEATEATRAIAETPGTCYLRLDRSSRADAPARGERFRLGRARVLREGRDITLVSTGGILSTVMKAADRLCASGVGCRILSVHTLKPFDTEAILSAARETGGIVSVEEHGIDGGLGSAVAEACFDAGVLPLIAARIAHRGGFSSVVGSQGYLRTMYRLDEDAIHETVAELLRRRSEESAGRETSGGDALSSRDRRQQ